MSKKMKAAVLNEFNSKLVIVEKDIPMPKDNEVRVKVMASGLCVSDIHIIDGIINTVKLPYTPGHEMAGIIDAVGKDVSNVKVGDHVCAAIDIVCGECKYCRSGRTNLCQNLVRIGFERDGSHEEYCVIPAANAFKVDDSIPFEQVTGFVDAVGCMYNAIKNVARVKPLDRVLIAGVGGLGMNAIQIAKVFGAEVFATSRRDEKLEIAKQMGADHLVNTKKEDLNERIREITNGEMLDVVIDNIGIENSVNDSLKLVCAGGKVVVTGYNDPQFVADYQDVMKFEKQILGMRGMTRADLAEVIKLVENKKITPYVYKTMPFEEINEALQEMRDGKAIGRIVLKMNEEGK